MYTLRQQAERLSRKITPAFITTLMMLFAAMPLHVPGAHAIMPSFTLINIFYWGIFAPGTLPYTFLFVLGLVQDALAGTPLGISSFANIFFALLLVIGRRLFGNMMFTITWFGFVLLSAVTLFVQWGVMSLYGGHLVPFMAVLLHWGASVLAYPLLHLLLTRVWRAVK